MKIPAIILAPLIAHPLWAVFMLFSPIPIHTLGIDSSYKITPGPISATILLFGASACAWISHCKKWHGSGKGFILIAPQQFLMLLSLWTIGVAVGTATYADGYAPPEGWWFIAADQAFFATCCVFHSIKVWQVYVTKTE